jgi:hypothetical protein
LTAVVPKYRDEGWRPGARTITNLSCVQELSKNRDKPIKHIVRVSGYASCEFT